MIDKITNVYIKSMEAYKNDDYAGLITDKVEFYFGYETTACPTHTNSDKCGEADCEEEEWCFTAKSGGKDLMMLTQAELGGDQDESDMTYFLLLGIGKFIDKYGILKV